MNITKTKQNIYIKEDKTKDRFYINSHKEISGTLLPYIFKKHKTLSKKELIDLVVEYQKTKDDKLKNKIVLCNLGLICNVVKGYYYNYERDANNYDSLIHWGVIGLLESIERFDHKMNYCFTTYASEWIRSQIVQSLYRSSDTNQIGLPSYMVNLIYRFHKYIKKNNLDLSSLKDDEMKVILSKITREKSNHKLEKLKMGLNVYGKDYVTIDNLKKLPLEHDGFNYEIDNKITIEKILKEVDNYITMKKYQEYYKDAFMMRHGLGDYDRSYSYWDIAKKHNKTRQRIDQIDKEIIKHLKKVMVPDE